MAVVVVTQEVVEEVATLKPRLSPQEMVGAAEVTAAHLVVDLNPLAAVEVSKVVDSSTTTPSRAVSLQQIGMADCRPPAEV